MSDDLDVAALALAALKREIRHGTLADVTDIAYGDTDLAGRAVAAAREYLAAIEKVAEDFQRRYPATGGGEWCPKCKRRSGRSWRDGYGYSFFECASCGYSTAGC